jgi:tryptophan halogenase
MSEYDGNQWYGDTKKESLDEQIQDIVIVGGGSAGWMAANYLGMIMNKNGAGNYENLGKIKSITIIESPDIKPIGVGEGTTPTIPKFMDQIGLDVDKFNPTYKYGINYQGWYDNNNFNDKELSTNNWFHPFEPLDINPNDNGIIKFFNDLKTKGLMTPFKDLFWSKYLMDMNDEGEDDLIDEWRKYMKFSDGGFAPPIESTNKFFKYDYKPLDKTHNPLPYHGYHFDIEDFVGALKDYCIKLNVVDYISDTVVGYNSNKDGSIKNVVLSEGNEISGDIFIDASGFNSVLFKNIYNEPFVDYSKYLPCNRAVSFDVDGKTRKHTYTTARAMSNGWSWKIPSGNKTGYGYVYNGDLIDEDKAIDELSKVTGHTIKDINTLSYNSGTYKRTWIKNCYAIGLSAGFYEPLEATSHMITYLQVTRLEGLISRLNNNTQKRPISELIDHHNDFMFNAFESLRNYLIPHYVLSNRKGDFWEYFNDLKLEDRTQSLLDDWKKNVNSFQLNLGKQFNTFHMWSWVYMMTGYDNLPNGVRVNKKTGEK